MGYNDKCWLNYKKLSDKNVEWVKEIVLDSNSLLIKTACSELQIAIQEIYRISPVISNSLGQVEEKKFIYLSLVDNEVLLKEKQLKDYSLSDEGFILKKVNYKDKEIILISGKSERGILYGVYHFIKLLKTEADMYNVNMIQNPANKIRILNHWDNMNGSIERGYAGESIFFKNGNIDYDEKRIKDYSRLISSIGINGVVINNVNVSDEATYLITRDYLMKLSKLAEIFRMYGIKLYLSINYTSPMELGGLQTADPLDAGVKMWWENKIDEIYSYIEDFGGFLVKADSEFRPGPFTYNRDHADGANLFADALAKHNGVVIWRCFVYNCQQDWRNYQIDRAKAAYDNFKPLDGKFKENVILQIKNGPMDFQVREPASPLFGAMGKTNQFIEFQVTQEYTGQQKHVCYLVPQWQEILDFETFAKDKDSKVKDIISGKTYNNLYSGMAGVANIGNDYNWTGHKLAQANLYGFGRLAWDPGLSCEQITIEWIKLTFGLNKKVNDTVFDILVKSWENYEKYTSPLGIGWMINPGHHYGPNIDGYEYSPWGTYHRADFEAIGVDRTRNGGTGYTGQYNEKNCGKFESLDNCPEELILFFHRLPYTYRLKSGITLIQHIYNTHFEGVEEVKNYIEKWTQLEGLMSKVDYDSVLKRLKIQLNDAREWRDVVNTYFYRKTGIDDLQNRKIYK